MGSGHISQFIAELKATPRETWNPRFIFSLLVISTAGWTKGYDEGGFSAAVTLPGFKNDFHLNASQWEGNAAGLANRNAWITSTAILGAAFGALLSLSLNNRLGRLKSWRVYAAWWAIGILLQIFSSGHFPVLMLGRVWAGLGAGALTVVGPLYLAEVSPPLIRGGVITLYDSSILLALMLGFFINYAVSVRMAATSAQYRIVLGIQLIPVGLSFISTFFVPESPRWLLAMGRESDAQAALVRLRHLPDDHPYVRDELNLTKRGLAAEEMERSQFNGWTQVWGEILTVPKNRKRLFLVLWLHTISQWSGGNGKPRITYYITQLFGFAGVTGAGVQLLSSGAYGVVKLVVTVIAAVFLIDTLGRRKCTFWALSLQFLAHAYLATYLGITRSNDTINLKSGAGQRASEGAIAAIFIYAVGYSMGLSIVPYIYSSETFPMGIRSVCAGTTMAVHWFWQFAVVRVTPNIIVTFDVWGAFVFWAAICLLGLITLGLMMPETRGFTLEDMEFVFDRPLLSGWRTFHPTGDSTGHWAETDNEVKTDSQDGAT